MILIRDIFSRSYKDGKKPFKYASKGQKAKLISDHGKAMIVEANGIKFPINREDVKTN